MNKQTGSAPAISFTPPGPGFWELETTHHGLRPLTMFVREPMKRAFESGIKVCIERYGLPLAEIRAELVHGCIYVRPIGIGEGDTPKAPPPDFVMKLIARLHPQMRRRARAAAKAWEQKLWRSEVDQWFDQDRGEIFATNVELTRMDLSGLDDEQLASHIALLTNHFETQARRNLETHGGDLMPVGDYLAHCEAWGIAPGLAATLLRGASPATIETAELLAPVATAIASSDSRPNSVEQIRQLGAESAAAVDAWIEHHGWRLLTSDDIDRPTLAELPALQLGALLAALEPEVVTPAEPESLRTMVPADQQRLFDELLEEACYGLRQRDDIRGLCWDWPGGLLRRGLLEAGRRIQARGQLNDPEHIVELTPQEVDTFLRQGTGATPDEVADRAAQRDRVEAAPPPRSFGEPEAPPPISALPAAMGRATNALMTMLGADATPVTTDEVSGTGVGVGNETYRGRACVATNAADALERLQPGDILITGFTGPSYNSIFPMLGALVVEEGGPLCHAAIMAREFGLPAVIGARGATIDITDGVIAEVDPVKGTVRAI